MSTRVISDRELLHNLRFELEELRRGLAAVVERLEVLEVPLELDSDRHSRRVDVDGASDDERFVDAAAYLGLTGRPTAVAS